MYIEEDAESNDEDDYVELIEVPDLENALENVSNDEENCRKKQKIQSEIISFFGGGLSKPFFYCSRTSKGFAREFL